MLDKLVRMSYYKQADSHRELTKLVRRQCSLKTKQCK